MVIQFGVKEHIKMAETYQWAEEELAKQRKRELELLEDSRRYWQGETADVFRQEHEFMLLEGEYAAYMKHVRGMKEVMEDSIPRFRRLQQMVVELPTAYGLPCDEEAPEILRLDEEAVAKYHELSDEILAKNRHFCEEMTRIMDGCDGLVDFSAERRELEELREDMRQMEVFKSKLDEYADEMRRMDNWMVERLSEYVKIGDGEKEFVLADEAAAFEKRPPNREENEYTPVKNFCINFLMNSEYFIEAYAKWGNGETIESFREQYAVYLEEYIRENWSYEVRMALECTSITSSVSDIFRRKLAEKMEVQLERIMFTEHIYENLEEAADKLFPLLMWNEINSENIKLLNDGTQVILPHYAGDGRITIGFGHCVTADEFNYGDMNSDRIQAMINDIQAEFKNDNTFTNHFILTYDEAMQLYYADYISKANILIDHLNLENEDEMILCTEYEFNARMSILYNGGSFTDEESMLCCLMECLCDSDESKENAFDLLNYGLEQGFYEREMGKYRRRLMELNLFFNNSYQYYDVSELSELEQAVGFERQGE